MASAMIRRNSFIIIGRAGMDLYADPPGTGIDEATSFMACLGGSSGNIAAGIARLGGHTSLLGVLSDDAVGLFTLKELEKYGINTDYIRILKGEVRTTLALAENRTGNLQTVIYRNGAADFELTGEQVRSVDFKNFGALILTGTSLAQEPSQSACFEAIKEARSDGCTAIIDIDYRPYSWTSLDHAAKIYRKAALECDIIIGNDDEFGVMAGSYENGEAYAKELADKHGKIAVYKMGPEGSKTFTPDASFITPIFKVEPMKPIGSGDAFMAAFATSLANGAKLQDAVKNGSAAAAIVVTKKGCAPAMPIKQELENFIKSHA